MQIAASQSQQPQASREQLPVLSTLGLTKKYGDHVALDTVSLSFLPGDVHVLFGENGAGKSTLISMIAGANPPSAGQIAMNGKPVRFGSVAEARAHGVRAVFQEFSLIPWLSVAQNITLGEEPVLGPPLLRRGLGWLSKKQARAEAQRLLDDLQFDLDPDAIVASLTRGKQQMVEICKAMRVQPRLLILDEPTASLSDHDSQALFRLVRRLKAAGVAIIYVTHRMHEIPLIGNEISVLRDGRYIDTVPADTPENDLIELMTGREMSKVYPVPRSDVGDVRFELRDMSLQAHQGEAAVQNVNLTVRAGEMVGLAGLVGCGKGLVGQGSFGTRRLESGEILIDGNKVNIRNPGDAIRQAMWYSPADRKTDGLALGRTARENIALSGLTHGAFRGPFNGMLLNPGAERAFVSDLARSVEFDSARLDEPVSNFSGGNQQKILLTKSLVQDINVFIFDEPTVGVDIGACLSIYAGLKRLADQGAAILLVSSNLPELMGLTNRMYVMSGGHIVAQFDRSEFDEHRILEKFF